MTTFMCWCAMDGNGIHFFSHFSSLVYRLSSSFLFFAVRCWTVPVPSLQRFCRRQHGDAYDCLKGLRPPLFLKEQMCTEKSYVRVFMSS